MSPNIIKQSFRVNLLAMRFFFLYPPEKYKTLYRVHTYIMYFLFVIPIPVLEIVYLIVENDLNFNRLVDNAFLMGEWFCFLLKLYPFLNNGERIKKCIHYFESAFFQVVRSKHQEILQQCVRTCQRMSALFFVAFISGYLTWTIRPISWKGHVFPTDLWLPFDVETAPKSWIWCTYAYIVIAVGYSAYSSAVVDPLLAGLAYQATCQIKILKDELQFLNEYIDEEMGADANSDPLRKSKLMYKRIRRCAIHHDLILDFVAEYEECFSQIAFSQFVTGVFVLCLSCLQLMIVDVLSLDCLTVVSYLIATQTQTYLYCHYGTILYEGSNTIGDAIYLGKWYEYDIHCCKALFVIMERAKRPLIVTCGKLVDMNLNTFAMIIRRSYSLLAVLRNYNLDIGQY